MFGCVAVNWFMVYTHCVICRKLVTAEKEPYFENYLDSVFNLYVLVTTANSPDVM